VAVRRWWKKERSKETRDNATLVFFEQGGCRDGKTTHGAQNSPKELKIKPKN